VTVSSSRPDTDTRRLLSPEEIATRAGQQVPFLQLPVRESVFADRALRLRQLAAGHSMRDFLLFAAVLAEGQHQLLQQPLDLKLPDDQQVAQAMREGRPLLQATRWQREAGWCEELRALLVAIAPRIKHLPAREVAQRLGAEDDEWIEQQAGRLLEGVMHGLDFATAPLLAAGLQLHFTRLVITTAAARTADREAPFGPIDDRTVCPCCGTRPVASVVRIGGDVGGFRFLQCALCSAQWHMVRIKCAHCESTKGISYRSLQPVEGHEPPATGVAEGALQAECCSECGHYLKILNQAKDPQAEAMADDLASVTLDLLVSDEGLDRHGLNLLLLFGDPDTPPDPGGG
jgi:FdhE protein